MKRWLSVLAVVLALGFFAFIGVPRWKLRNVQSAPPTGMPPEMGEAARKWRPKAKTFQPPPGASTAADRMAWADKIRRDYDEMTTKFSADYSAAGEKFPGGLSAYLRQLALLQREKHKDLAALLTPLELEDLEMRDTNAGQTVTRLLGDTAATEEQRRAVFRLQKEFEDRYSLVFDLSASALFARETERQALQHKIRAVLGDEVFGAWLRNEGPDYANFTAFVQRQGFAPGTALDLWRAKSEFILGRLQLKARPDITVAQQGDAERALIAQTLTRVTGIIGPTVVAGPGREVLTWLPLPPAK